MENKDILPAAARVLMFAPVAEETNVVYRLAVAGQLKIKYYNRALALQESETLLRFAFLSKGPYPLNWDSGRDLPFDPAELCLEPQADLNCLPVPCNAISHSELNSWRQDLAQWAYQEKTLELMTSPLIGCTSDVNESEQHFRSRIADVSQKACDQAIEKIKEQYAAKLLSLDEKLKKARLNSKKTREKMKRSYTRVIISLASTVLSALIGKKIVSQTTLGRATTTARDLNRSAEQKGTLNEKTDNTASLLERKEKLERLLSKEIDRLKVQYDPAMQQLQKTIIRPLKKDIKAHDLFFVWVPVAKDQPAKPLIKEGLPVQAADKKQETL